MTPPRKGLDIVHFFADVCARRRCSCARSSGVSSAPKSSASKTCRISISASAPVGLGQRFTHSIASSFDFTCHSQKPAIRSFASRKGPVVTVRLLPENFTRAPLEVGLSPSPASITPAFTSSSLNRPISVNSFSLGIWPASVSLVALIMTMNRIASPHGFRGWGRRARRPLPSSRTPQGEIDNGTILPGPTPPPGWVLFTDAAVLGGGLEGGEGEHAGDEEEVVEIGMHVVVVGVTAARTVETAGYAGLPEMRGVVAGIALRETDTEILRVPPGQGLEMVPHHLDNRLGQGHVDGGLGETAQSARELGREFDLVLELGIIGLEGVEGAPEVGENGLAALARIEADVHVGSAEVAHRVGSAQIVVATTPPDHRAHVEAGQSREIGIVHRRHVHGIDGGDGAHHLGDGVRALLLLADVSGTPER